MNKSAGGYKLTTNNVGKLPSKSSTSSKECDTKSNNSVGSRTSKNSNKEVDKAEQFRQMVSSHSSLQLTKSAMKVPAVSPMEISLQFFFNKKINDAEGYNTVEDVKKDLKNFTQLSDVYSDERKREEVQNILDKKRRIIAGEEDAYAESVVNNKELLRADLKAKKKDTVAFKMAESKSIFFKNLFAGNNDGDHLKSLDDMAKDIKQLTEFELPLITCKIDALKAEMSHRIRLLEERCANLLEEAIQPDDEKDVPEQESQQELDWGEKAPSVKKSRTR